MRRWGGLGSGTRLAPTKFAVLVSESAFGPGKPLRMPNAPVPFLLRLARTSMSEAPPNGRTPWNWTDPNVLLPPVLEKPMPPRGATMSKFAHVAFSASCGTPFNVALLVYTRL